MKLAKRIITILLIASLCLSMVACSNANIFGMTAPTTPLDTASNDYSTQSDSTIAAGESYRSVYFKFTCDLPEVWYVLNEDEMSQMIGTTFDALGEGEASDALQKSFNNGETHVDFYALTLVLGQAISIVLSEGKLRDLIQSEQQLLEASVPLLTSGLEGMGATNITYDTREIEFLGKEHTALVVQSDFQGSSSCDTIFLLRKGLFMSTITISDFDGNIAQDSLAYFQVID